MANVLPAEGVGANAINSASNPSYLSPYNERQLTHSNMIQGSIQDSFNTSINNVDNHPRQDQDRSLLSENSDSSGNSVLTSAETTPARRQNENNQGNNQRPSSSSTLTPVSSPTQQFPIHSGWLRTRWYTCHTFEEAIMTLRPTSAACLLALMAMCNLGSLFFHSYATLWWFTRGNVSVDFIACGGEVVCWLSTCIIFGPDGSESQSLISQMIWLWLLAQLVVGVFKLFFRVRTKRLCIQFMRNPTSERQTNENQEEIGNILHSVSFRVHSTLGRTAQVLALLGHLLYLYIGDAHIKDNASTDKASDLNSTQVLLDVCCANVVIAFFRAGVALYVLHYYAFQDQAYRLNPQPNKSGLSQFELFHVLKKIKYAKPKGENEDESSQEAFPTQCSICLQSFQEGEILSASPCDDRHVFHSLCIRTWLSKRDSCPLCNYNLRYMEHHK